MPDNKDQLFTEILASDKVGAYMAFAYNLPGISGAIPDNPTWVWQQLRWNPWMAMAVFEDMEEKDAMVGSSLDTRKDGVLAKPRIVLPASEKRQDKKLAEFIDETIHNYYDARIGAGSHFGFSNFLYEALDGVGRGVSIGEVIYGNGPDRIYIKEVKFKPQHLFSFGDSDLASYANSSYLYPQTGPLRLRQGIFLDGMPDGGLLPENKFFVHTYRPRYSNRWGTPLLRKVYWPSWFKRAGVRQWLRYMEKGAGSVVSKYRPGAGEAEQERALQAAQAISEEGAIAIPDNFVVEVMEGVRNIGSSHTEFIDDFCNSEIARAILGQTLTSRGSDGGGSRALGQVHDQVRGEKIEADSVSLMLAVNMHYVWPLTLLNHGPVSKPPIWTIKYDPQKDLKAIVDWLSALWEMHLPIPKSFVYNTFQVPEPSEDDVLPAPDKGDKVDEPNGVESGDFAESQKKKPASSGRLNKPQSLRTARFQRLRPSTMKSSEK